MKHLLSIACLLLSFYGCVKRDEVAENGKSATISFPEHAGNLNGKQLAAIYCQGCHLLPEPALLDKKIWKENVLPRMGLRLGINTGKDPYGGMGYMETFLIESAGIFPSSPLISKADWQKIETYYINESPENPQPQPEKAKPATGLEHFKPLTPAFNRHLVPFITLLKIDTSSNMLYIGDARNEITVIDPHQEVLKSLYVDSPPSYLRVGASGEAFVLTMGVMQPNDLSLGKLTGIHDPTGEQNNPIVFFDSLPRPVHASFADVNRDQVEDIVLCGFGNYLGKFSWYENLSNGHFKEHILKNLPGALQSYVHDFNRDGLQDIVVLMGQGDEGIYIFYNKGHNTFEEEAVKRFPPLYGSSHLEVVDFNQDGWMDLLYTNGDNADYSFSLKAYHGIRLFLNNGSNQFDLAFFYPMFGATKALARDFDQDGDLDIAAIAYFADYTQRPNESFVLLDNKGSLQFEPASFEDAARGRWLVMETGDTDNDCDTDIILGAFNISAKTVPKKLQKKWRDQQYPVIVLENTLF